MIIKKAPYLPSRLTYKEVEVVPAAKIQSLKIYPHSSPNNSSKHQTAVQMTEASFNTYIGSVSGLDVNDPAQFAQATYNPDEYFLGGILSAVKTGIEKQEMLTFDFGWKPLILLPKTHEIWVDADEKQIRAFAGLKQKEAHHAHFSFKPFTVDPDALTLAPEKLHSIDAFVWKLAGWRRQNNRNQFHQ
ncbi:hypothetical protein [Methylicorpusculum sp.]|uniref:hypothetical protein n=1 Tax=Methylicorpusculum sp. TaxID=2713644 RepID=UPI00271C3AAD|nr:hypothetical protein [Methylicorpusculum sp.]MDO8845277.1 hypothetical protein [Methylicorpusculum sp.]